MSIATPRILFIGAGRMAEAIFSGLIHHNEEMKQKITVSNRSDERRLKELEDRYGVKTTSQWQKEVPEAEIILLAMPPEAHHEVLNELSLLVKEQFVVTVAAGMGTKRLEESLPAGTPVAWVMPNTAADIGESMSLYACGKSVGDNHRQMLKTILDAIGESEECDEQQIHELTAITGSAPAFVYHLAEILEKTAMKYGIDRSQARKLVTQMIYGAGAMLKTGEKAETLREQVTTPGGATAAGLKVLAQKDFAGALKQAVQAVNARAEEQAES